MTKFLCNFCGNVVEKKYVYKKIPKFCGRRCYFLSKKNPLEVSNKYESGLYMAYNDLEKRMLRTYMQSKWLAVVHTLIVAAQIMYYWLK